MRRVVTLVAAGLMLAACSAGTQAAAPPPASSPAPGSTSAAPAGDAGADVVRRVTGAIARDASYHLVVVPGQDDVLLPAEGDIRLVPGSKGYGEDMDVTLMAKTKPENPDEPVHLVAVAGTTYVLLLPAQNPPPGKPWAKLDEKATDEFTDWTLSRRDEFAQFGIPTGYALPMLAAGGALTAQSPGTEPGQIRYRYTLDLKRAVANLTDPFLKDEAQRGLDQGGQSLDFELLVGPRDQLAELVMHVVVVKTGKEVVSTAKFSDWGKPVTLTPPSDAETTSR